jgi:hypothetical protein
MQKSKTIHRFFLVFVIISSVSTVRAADVAFVEDGRSRVAIVADAATMAPDIKGLHRQTAEYDREQLRIRVRESVKDLALYIHKMSGAEVKIHPETSADGRVPIYVGALAEDRFGKVNAHDRAKQGYRVVVTPQAIGLYGESPLATSYAIYDILERFGCHWYMPGDLGEVVPERKTIRLPVTDESLTPTTLYRGIWYADEAFKRRTWQGGIKIAAGHALERYLSKDQLEAHLDWCALIKGKRSPSRLCWANPEVSAAVADAIVARLDKNYTPSISLSPGDGASFCECEKCKALDAGDWDPSMGVVSITDRYVWFCNRIAERVTKKYPDVLLGFLAYVQYTRPPVREKPHPSLVPHIAPITYCRAHTMLQTDLCPSRAMIRPIVEGWGRIVKNVSYYNYMFHLAEVTVPYPMMRQMSEELPLLYANHVRHWQPETMPNFESVLPGMVLAMRMSRDATAKPAEIMAEFFTKFYGAAAAPMRHYWTLFDNAWTTVPEHAGNAFGYPRRFSPAMMKEARSAMDKALVTCRTDIERRRVKLHDDALKQFELFMKLRWDLFEGRLASLGADSSRYVDRQKALGDEYAAQYAFTKVYWAPETVGVRYFKHFFKRAYDDAARIARDYSVISPPLRQWRYQADKEKRGESLGWRRSEFDDRGWKTTDPCVNTWFALGLDAYYGSMFYRTTVNIPAIPVGRKVYLWIGSADDSAKVFVNGRHIPYVNEKGEKTDESSGFCRPASFEITPAIKANGGNQITIVATRTFLNELGTGGLIGPVYIYREKP